MPVSIKRLEIIIEVILDHTSIKNGTQNKMSLFVDFAASNKVCGVGRIAGDLG